MKPYKRPEKELDPAKYPAWIYDDGDGAEDFSKQVYTLRGQIMDGGADGLEFNEVKG